MSFKKPDGSITKSRNAYMRAWRSLAAPIAKVTGYELIAYDPGLLFDIDGNTSWDLPTSVAIKLADALRKVKP